MIRKVLKIFRNKHKITYTTKEELLQKLESNDFSESYTDSILKFETENKELNFLISNYLLNHLNRLKIDEFEKNKNQFGNKIFSTLEKLKAEEIPESKFIEASVAFILKNGFKIKSSYDFLSQLNLNSLSIDQIFQIFILACHLGKYKDAQKYGLIIEQRDPNFLKELEVQIENLQNLMNYPKIYKILKTGKFENTKEILEFKSEKYVFQDIRIKLLKSFEKVKEQDIQHEVIHHLDEWEISEKEEIPPIQIFGNVVTWLQVDVAVPLTGIFEDDKNIVLHGNGIRETKNFGEVYIDVKYKLNITGNEVFGKYQRKILVLESQEENFLEYNVEGRFEIERIE
eukprot:gene2163-2028_t